MRRPSHPVIWEVFARPDIGKHPKYDVVLIMRHGERRDSMFMRHVDILTNISLEHPECKNVQYYQAYRSPEVRFPFDMVIGAKPDAGRGDPRLQQCSDALFHLLPCVTSLA